MHLLCLTQIWNEKLVIMKVRKFIFISNHTLILFNVYTHILKIPQGSIILFFPSLMYYSSQNN